MKLLKQNQEYQKSQKLKKMRQALLAKAHIAIKALGISETDYRSILKDAYGVSTAAKLSIEELQDFVARCEHAGWKPSSTKRNKQNQLKALRMRAEEIACQLPNGARRLIGLSRKICGVDSLEWADLQSLKQLLAALERIKDET